MKLVVSSVIVAASVIAQPFVSEAMIQNKNEVLASACMSQSTHDLVVSLVNDMIIDRIEDALKGDTSGRKIGRDELKRNLKIDLGILSAESIDRAVAGANCNTNVTASYLGSSATNVVSFSVRPSTESRSVLIGGAEVNQLWIKLNAAVMARK